MNEILLLVEGDRECPECGGDGIERDRYDNPFDCRRCEGEGELSEKNDFRKFDLNAERATEAYRSHLRTMYRRNAFGRGVRYIRGHGACYYYTGTGSAGIMLLALPNESTGMIPAMEISNARPYV